LDVYFSALRTAIDAGTVILLAGMGGLLMERTGVLNLGLEGLVSIGAVAAVIAASNFDSPFLCLLVAILAGAGLNLVFGVATVVVRANQVLCGLAIVLLGTGLANQIGSGYTGAPVGNVFTAFEVPVLSDIPKLGRALFVHDPLVFASYLLVPAVVWFVLFRTRHGMNLRAVGQNPGAADAAGVRVMAIRLLYTLIGGGLAGAGGASLTLSFTPGWSQNVVSGRGWVALAVVIFAAWRPWRLAFGALLFGAMVSLSFIAQDQGWGAPAPLLNMLPYVVTLVLIVLAVAAPSRRRGAMAPAALAIPYFREER
jgi:general nucleoside transport system permease protein